MASVSTDKKTGSHRIKFYGPNGLQHGIRVGKCPKRDAERLCRDIEEVLIAKKLGQPPSAATADRLGRVSEPIRLKLERAGVLEPATARRVSDVRLAAFLQDYITNRADLKKASRDNLQQAVTALTDFFGSDKPLNEITPGDAEEFRNWLRKGRKRPLAVATANRLCRRAKQFFGHAVKKRLLTEDPFNGMPGLRDRTNKDRQRFIDRQTSERLLEVCPSVDWRVLVALCRYGGMRPSEACNIRWEHVDWDRNRVRVRCDKTAHHQGRDWREIPIFPELRLHLEEAWEMAADGAEMVVVGYRSSQNLGTLLKKIMKRNGIHVWPKPFQNLRSTRETELVKEYSIHVVCSWLGNSPKVATEHYLQVTDSDFQRATTELTGDTRPSTGGPKSGPALTGKARQERHGEKSPRSATVKNTAPNAGCRSSAQDAAPCEKEPSSPSRIRTYNLAVNSRSLYR